MHGDERYPFGHGMSETSMTTTGVPFFKSEFKKDRHQLTGGDVGQTTHARAGASTSTVTAT